MDVRMIQALGALRRAHGRIFKPKDQAGGLRKDYEGQVASDAIRDAIEKDVPCMVCRFGDNELKAMVRYLEIIDGHSFLVKALKYVRNEIGPFWWDECLCYKMENNAGLFPGNADMLRRFGIRMLEDIKQIDILGSWRPGEVRLRQFFPDASIVRLQDLEPYYHAHPWSEALAGKTVLVVHPFAESIRKQYENVREKLFSNPKVLPDFRLVTLKAVQSAAQNETGYSDWMEALEWMCDRISKEKFDVAIIGAGAYGMPLAAHVKRIGKKAIHLGGATQILFGIKGRRWDDNPFFKQFYNKCWIRPSEKERPANSKNIESGCYW